jgi:hypothetical protein
MTYYNPQLDDLYLIEYKELKGKKQSTNRPCLILEIKNGYALCLPYSASDTYYDIDGKFCKRGKYDIKQPKFGGRTKDGWLAFSTAAWFKLNKKGELNAKASLGYAPIKYAEQAYNAWLEFIKRTGYEPPFYG